MGGVSSVNIKSDLQADEAAAATATINEIQDVSNSVAHGSTSGTATFQWQLNEEHIDMKKLLEANQRLRNENEKLQRELRASQDLREETEDKQQNTTGIENSIILSSIKTDSFKEQASSPEEEEVKDTSKLHEDGIQIAGSEGSGENISVRSGFTNPGNFELEQIHEGALRMNEERQDLQVFREKMKGLREARQQAISQKSRELQELREQVKKEQALRLRMENSLKLLLRGEEQGLFQADIMDKESNNMREENRQLQEKLTLSENKNGKLNVVLLQRDNDYADLVRRYERLKRDQCSIMEENKRLEEELRASKEEKEKMWQDYDSEKEEIALRTAALKEVIRISREMLTVREQQVIDLKSKLAEIEENFAVKLENTDLKLEYEKQLENIKELKDLYEERNRILEADRGQLLQRIASLKDELDDLNIKYDIAAEEVDTERQTVAALTEELASSKAQAKSWQKELTLMNTLLTQMLVGGGPPGPRVLDKLTEQLQENHAIISQITSCEECSDDAALLPKLLLDLCTQMDERDGEWPNATLTQDIMTDSIDDPSTISEPSEGLPIVSYKNAKVFHPVANHASLNETPEADNTRIERSSDNGSSLREETAETDSAVQEIITNLPKVWRVLSELLSHHSTENQPCETRNCYKSVETPDGPRTVISVSDTFIRLKELIIEKKGLIREVSRLRHLNSHLETRLDDQEKRLSTVQSELHKTWGVVGRMRAQHQQLHNQEKILRYELQEKRIMVNELKAELDDCRDLWERARRKNNESETECHRLRSEFAARRAQTLEMGCSGHESGSGESGFSDNDDHCDADRSTTPSPTPTEKTDDGSQKDVSDFGAILIDFASCGEALQIIEEICEGPEVEGEPGSINTENCSENSEQINTVVDQATLQESPSESDEKGPALPHELTEANYLSEFGKNVGTEEVVSNQMNNVVSLETSLPSGEPCESVETAEENAVAMESSPPRLLENSLGSNSFPDQSVILNPPTLTLDTILSNEDICCSFEGPSTSSDTTSEEDCVKARSRSLRLQRLEEECQLLVRKVDITSHKSKYLSSRLEELHDHYSIPSGELPTPNSQGSVHEALKENDDGEGHAVKQNQEDLNLQPKSLGPGCSTDSTPLSVDRDTSIATLDERMRRKEEKMKRLEALASSLHGQISNTVNRGNELSQKLTEIHEEIQRDENLRHEQVSRQQDSLNEDEHIAEPSASVNLTANPQEISSLETNPDDVQNVPASENESQTQSSEQSEPMK